jgi:hypothetical protein
MAKAKKGLDGRHRDKSGRIERKHGNTRVAALRKEYGESFAEGAPQGHDAENSAQRDGQRLASRVFAASSQVAAQAASLNGMKGGGLCSAAPS